MTPPSCSVDYMGTISEEEEDGVAPAGDGVRGSARGAGGCGGDADGDVCVDIAAEFEHSAASVADLRAAPSSSSSPVGCCGIM